MDKVVKTVMNTPLEELKAKEDEIYKLWQKARLFVQMKEVFIAGEKYNEEEQAKAPYGVYPKSYHMVEYNFVISENRKSGSSGVYQRLQS